MAQFRDGTIYITFLTWNQFDGSTTHQCKDKTHLIPCGSVKFENDLANPCSFALCDPTDSTSLKRIRVMGNIFHHNLLNGFVFNTIELKEGNRPPRQIYELFTDPSTGSFENFIKNNFSLFFGPKVHAVGDFIIKFLRGLINAIAFLHHKNSYHGDVKPHNILYYIKYNRDGDRNYVFFLANYKQRGKTKVAAAQAWDWHSLADDVIAPIVASYTVKRKEDCVSAALDDLIKTLKSADTKKIGVMKARALNSLPFQQQMDRHKYMTVLVPLFMRSNDYKRELDGMSSTFLNGRSWTSDDCIEDYLLSMDAYRKTNLPHMSAYNGQSFRSFVKFVSGVYTHYFELKNVPSTYMTLEGVEDIFLESYPTLFLILKDIERDIFPNGFPIP